jgi:hypothetical protein
MAKRGFSKTAAGFEEIRRSAQTHYRPQLRRETQMENLRRDHP